jgi:excinuclease ABC subunit A
MAQDFIKVRGARVHNLKNINVDIPKEKLVVITGISGSGKSSLAFDTLYAEGQRRYVESLSVYARQFLGVMQKPDVDKIEGISPAIALDQRKSAKNPRSTVGTITEIYDYLRLLFARIGQPHCYLCKRVVSSQTVDQIISQILNLPKQSEIFILAPLIKGKKGEHRTVLEEIEKAGFIKVRLDGKIYRLSEMNSLEIDRNKKHSLEVVVDRLTIEEEIDRLRLADSVETALKIGRGILIVNLTSKKKEEDFIFSQHFACPWCGISLPELEPRLFSFNSPYGACPACEGLGEKFEVSPELVVPDPSLSIREGAIQPWMKASHRIGRQGYFWWRLKELSERENFSLDVPFKKLPARISNLILFGGEDFEGVIPFLERRYRETDSESTREEIKKYMLEKKCQTCGGKRLRKEALAVTVFGKNIFELGEIQIDQLTNFFEKILEDSKQKEEKKIALTIIKEILKRLQFLVDVGVGYLTLNRRADSLSGGEEERIRLATQIGSQLAGVLYILDEPSIGLHARDQGKLITTLKKLRDLKNTVLVVEHDPQTMLAADWLIEIGPGAGKEGGNIVFEGTPKQLLKAKTLTGQYLAGKKKIKISKSRTENNQKYLIIRGAKENNLKNINVKIPLGKFVCVSGVSGSGKSTLVNDILAKALFKYFYNSKELPGAHEKIEGLENLDKVVLIDQSPIGRTPRSNPATYTNVFSDIRSLFAKTREARIRGFGPGRFSFNVKGGRCEACEGQGIKKVEMYFLPDVYVECQECRGQRYNQETLEIQYRGKNIAQVLKLSIAEAREFFKNIPSIFQKLSMLCRVGLGYLELGQSALTLSGGEAQRIKLAAELIKKATGRTIYILDEPTTGLHFEDIKNLLAVLQDLRDKGNTVLVIEHNLEVLKNADWLIDLGPEGGDKGGKIIAQGPPEIVAQNPKSYTGFYLKKFAF